MLSVSSISSIQSRIARIYLEWHQKDLAEIAELSLSTVRSFENGTSSRPNSVIRIKRAFESNGIEFSENHGVHLPNNKLITYRGSDSRARFGDDLLSTITHMPSDVCCLTRSADFFMRSLESNLIDGPRLIEALGSKAKFKLIIKTGSRSGIDVPTFELRKTLDLETSPFCYFVYGNKYVQVIEDEKGEFLFAVYNVASAAETCRSHFQALWKNSLPVR